MNLHKLPVEFFDTSLRYPAADLKSEAKQPVFPKCFEISPYAIHIWIIQKQVFPERIFIQLRWFRKDNGNGVLEGNRWVWDNRFRKNCMSFCAELASNPKNNESENSAFRLDQTVIITVDCRTGMVTVRTFQLNGLCQENCVSLYNKLHKALHYITAVPGPFPEQPFFDGNDVKR